MTEKELSENHPSRRRLLGMLGSGTAATVYVGSGVASADPGKGRGQRNNDDRAVGPCVCEDDCPEGTFCGKIEGHPEQGKTYTFTGDDDEYSITIDDVIRKPEENEITCFEFSSSDDIQRVCVKGGPDTSSYDGDDLDGVLCAPKNPGGQQAGISNISFCGTEATETVECFQLDLVGGDPIEQFDPDSGETYSAENRLIEDFFVCYGEDETESADEDEEVTVTPHYDTECTFSWDSFNFDGEVATITLTLVEEATRDRCEGSFVGYLLPEGVTDEPGDLEEQEFRTSETVILDEGESATLRINLTPRLKWRFETGNSVRSSPTIVDGTVYFGSVDNNVYALDAETGDEQWRFETGDHVLSSPNVVDGTVYIGSRDNHVYALDTEDGEEQWRFETDSLVQSSPTVFDSTVYVGSRDSNVYAIDAESGDEQWRFETGDYVRSSPTVVDGTVYVASFDDALYALDADDGTKQWDFDTEINGISSPTVADDTVYIGRYDDALYALDADDGAERWRFDTDASVFSSPTVANSMVYVGDASGGGNVYAIDAQTGDEQWRFDAGRSVHDSSPTVADGTVYIGSLDESGYAIDAETGEKQWRFATAGAVSSSPTVVNGVVYVGSRDSFLYALDADTDGNSEDSRVQLGTLGHHSTWADHDRS
ncbi:MAG: PQQ-binding-like beta-propeller repeat protein [Halovenus sp.]